MPSDWSLKRRDLSPQICCSNAAKGNAWSDNDFSMGDLDQLTQYLGANRSELIEFTTDLIEFDTQNPPGETRDVIDWIERTLAHDSLDIERHVVDPAKPNLLVRIPGQNDGCLGFNGHVDTVRFDGREWTRDPLGERDQELIFGRGATDMKGAVAAMMAVIRAFAETDIEPPLDIVIAFVSDEEVGSDAGTKSLLEANRFQPDACVVGETTSRAGRYSVSIADRGRVWVTLDATGRAAHGSRPILGDNAIDRLYSAIEGVRETLQNHRLELPSAMDPIVEETIDFYAPEVGGDAVRRVFRYPTDNLGVIEGGTGINTVPSRAHARLDVRVTAGADLDAVINAIRERISGIDEVTITALTRSPGTWVPRDSPIAIAATRAGELVTDERVYRRSATGGSDASLLRSHGIDAVEFGFGTKSAHGVDEYTTVDDLRRNATAYCRVPFEYAKASSRDSLTP